jgi:hypothetical protein
MIVFDARIPPPEPNNTFTQALCLFPLFFTFGPAITPSQDWKRQIKKSTRSSPESQANRDYNVCTAATFWVHLPHSARSGDSG